LNADPATPVPRTEVMGSVASLTPAYEAYRRRLRAASLLVTTWQICLVAAFLIIWQIAPQLHWVNPMLTSYPTAVFWSLLAMTQDGTLLLHVKATILATAIGFVGGMVLGTGTAIVLWWSPFVYRVLDPFVVVINAIPKIALVPIFYIWLGDMMSIYAMAVAVSVFVTVIMLYTGFQAIDPDKIKLVRLFSASRLQVLTKVVLPGSVPTMMSTLKVNIGLTLVGVVVGEFQSAKAGLGYLITYGSQIFQMNMVMSAIVVLAFISSLLFVAVQVLEAVILRRRSGGVSSSR
jgi:NitT/TauT family transport system permease protein